MKKFLFLLFVSILLGTLVQTAFAIEFQPTFPLPCLLKDRLGQCSSLTDEGFIGYIKTFYQFSLGIGGVLAAGMIAAGAIYRAISAGSPDKINEANSMITSALYGLVLLFGSYLILKTVNPVLVKLREPQPPPAATSTFIGFTPASCPGHNEEDPNDKFACITSPNRPLTIEEEDLLKNGLFAVSVLDHATDACVKRKCYCQNCYILPNTNDLPIKSGICRDQNGKSLQYGCFLGKETAVKLRGFLKELRGDNDVRLDPQQGWRITEAFPPTAAHLSFCHYIGTCFDFGTQNIVIASSPSEAAKKIFCNQVKKVYSLARKYFSGIAIESATSTDPSSIKYCESYWGNEGPTVQTFETTTGFHLHITL